MPGLEVHRLVVDESHLLDSGSWKSQKTKLMSVPASFVWCVTGTPFSNGLGDLQSQVCSPEGENNAAGPHTT